MRTTDLKKRLIKRIKESDDPVFIQEINTFIDFNQSKEPYKLTTAEEQELAEARIDIEQGNILTEKQANDLTEKWLNEQ